MFEYQRVCRHHFDACAPATGLWIRAADERYRRGPWDPGATDIQIGVTQATMKEDFAKIKMVGRTKMARMSPLFFS